MVRLKSYTFYIVTILVALLLSGCGNSASDKTKKRVLVIHSYQERDKSYPDFNRFIEEEFEKADMDVEISTFYLDCEMFLAKAEEERMNRMIDSVKVSFKPDVIIVNEDQATYSLLATENPFIYSCPIVFAGVNFPNWELLKKHSNITGFWDKLEIIKNYHVMRELIKRNDNSIFVFCDNTFIDKQTRNRVREEMLAELNKYEQNNNLPLTLSDDPLCDAKISAAKWQGFIPAIELTAMVEKGDTGLLWRFSDFSSKLHYLQTKRDFKVNGVSLFLKYESITAINEAFGYSEMLLGGYFTPLDEQVREEVGAAVKILKGEKPSNIPIAESKKEYLLDWTVMKKFNIPLSQVDQDKYKIINISFIERYPTLSYLIISFISIALLIGLVTAIVLYIKENNRRKGTLKDLEHSMAETEDKTKKLEKTMITLEEEKESLAISIRGSNTYAWKWIDNKFEFDECFWDTKIVASNDCSLSFDEFASFIEPKDINEFRNKFNNFTKEDKGSVQIEGTFKGEVNWWEIRYTTFQANDGELSTVGLMINIQAHKDYEKELEQSRDAAAKAELKQSFLANMSHEIRTPLNAIVGFSNLLNESDDMDKEDKEEYIKLINYNSDLLLKLIGDILELSRIESGQMDFDFEKITSFDALKHVYDTNCVLVPSHLELIKDFEEKPDYYIYVDKLRIIQVLTNFVSNAFKFTPSGRVTIGQKFKEETQEIELYVEDTGIGISEQSKKMIFDRFYKDDEFAQGTGLGLSICSVITDKMHGRIDLQSELGKGSRFSVYLPIFNSEPK
ncbi:MAG: HAMP domain-containing sensor histidine kinase [Muribaculaceae bacterium]|nr:HAMP domain-containing sensor histidine kinase [Muribaculaceae bacterium]